MSIGSSRVGIVLKHHKFVYTYLLSIYTNTDLESSYGVLAAIETGRTRCRSGPCLISELQASQGIVGIGKILSPA